MPLAVPTVAMYQDIQGYWGDCVVIALDELQDVPFEPFPFLAPWTDWTDDVNVQTAGFRLVGNMVQLRGIAKRNAATSGQIGTLPSGYRPPLHVMISTTLSTPGHCRTDVYSDGRVVGAVGQTLPTAYITLDGIVLLDPLMPGTFVPDPILNPRLSASWGATVATAITELQQGPWTAFPFTAPWTNWSTLDPSWQNCEYRKVGDLVQLRGLARRANAAGQTLGYLPAGFQPLKRLHHTSVCDAVWTYVVIEPSGQVWLTPGSSADGWASLTGLKFSTVLMATTVSAPTLGQDVVFGWFNSVSAAITELQSNVPWINLAFRSPWNHYHPTWTQGQYRKIEDMVQLRGLLARNSAANGYMADLPVGYRPTKTIMFLQTYGEPPSPVRVDVYTDGAIYATAMPVTWLCLDNIQFSTRA